MIPVTVKYTFRIVHEPTMDDKDSMVYIFRGCESPDPKNAQVRKERTFVATG